MPNPTPKRTLIAIATYNEGENLERLLDAIFAKTGQVHVLVTDDASPDGTGEIADAFSARDSRVQVLHRPGKLGLGSAILDGLRFGIDNEFDFVLTMDADFSHSPDNILDLISGMSDHDVVIGSRYIPGGSIGGWSWTRKFMSWGINYYSRILLGMKTRDCSGGFRCYRVAKLREIDFDRMVSKGYSFEEEFLYRCFRVGCRVSETPIHFENRKHGKSKINFKEALWSLWALILVSIRG